ncbi:hypothetical protein JCM8547_003732 [Rhodosporidiobolus lusitaniae]
MASSTAVASARPATASRPRSKPPSKRMPPSSTSANSLPSSSTAVAPFSAATRGKRSRPSGGESEMEKERPRRSKSSRGQKRTEDDKGKGKKEDGGKQEEAGAGNPLFRRAMYARYVEDAFQTRLKGNNDSYNAIISQFRSLLPSASSMAFSQSASSSSAQGFAVTSLAQLRAWLDALTAVVSRLDQSHAPLVETILAVPWATTEDSFVAVYMRFIGALVSARPEWLKVVLEKCVKGFKYRSLYTQSSPHALPNLTRRLIYSRIHSLLRLLLSLVPTMSPSLTPILTYNFPNRREPRAAQICYIDNLLGLTEYCTALSEDVLTLVIERALNIDVEIQGEPDEWEELEEEMLAAEEEEERAAAEAAAAAGEKVEQSKKDTAAVKELIDRGLKDDPDDSASDDDSDEEGGFNFDDLSSGDEEPEPIGDDDAARRAKKRNEMSEATVRRILDSRRKLDGILKVILDHLAAAHGDVRAFERNNTTTLGGGATSLATATGSDVFDSAFATAGNGEAIESTSRETTPTKADAPEIPTAEQLERRVTLFRTLLDIFDRTLLRTFKTRNVQFILFYLCSLNVTSSDHFIGVLLGRALFDQDAPAVTRVAAAGYAASFVARAKYVDAPITRKVVRHLCQYLEGQMDDFARAAALATSVGGKNGPLAGGQELPVFYAVAQAVFYIFCFRWKDLLDEEDDFDDEAGLLGLDAGRRWMMGLETVKKAVGSSFNPLKVCAQPVVNQFATIAHKTNFMYCFGIIDANRRASSYRDPSHPSTSSHHPPAPPLRSVSTSSMLNTLVGSSLHLSTPLHSPSGTPAPPSFPLASSTTANPSLSASTGPSVRQLLVAEEMDSFFPFDPFKLPLSSGYIDPIYREWEGADEDESSTSEGGDNSSSTADDSDSDEEDSSSSVAEDDDEEDATASWARGGLAVPGMKIGGRGDEEDDEVSRSFEAMSLSLSPHEESFGGRKAAEQAFSSGKKKSSSKGGKIGR